jgi:hypothetical protein
LVPLSYLIDRPLSWLIEYILTPSLIKRKWEIDQVKVNSEALAKGYSDRAYNYRI